MRMLSTLGQGEGLKLAAWGRWSHEMPAQHVADIPSSALLSATLRAWAWDGARLAASGGDRESAGLWAHICSQCSSLSPHVDRATGIRWTKTITCKIGTEIMSLQPKWTLQQGTCPPSESTSWELHPPLPFACLGGLQVI